MKNLFLKIQNIWAKQWEWEKQKKLILKEVKTLIFKLGIQIDLMTIILQEKKLSSFSMNNVV